MRFSKHTAEARAYMVARTIREVQQRHIDSPEVAHLVFLVVHDHKKQVAVEVAQPHLAKETVEFILKEALSTYSKWGCTPPQPSYQVVGNFTLAIGAAVQNLSNVDQKFRETAILCAHPDGAACLVTMKPANNRSREILFAVAGVKYAQ